MHELSIAESIIEISEAAARAQGSRHIRAINLRLGEFTTIVSEALQFSFEIARKGTVAEDATLEIESVPMVVRCGTCGDIGEVLHEVCLNCPRCGAAMEIISGDEIHVEYIEVD